MKKILAYGLFVLLALQAQAQVISHSVCANDPRVKRYFVQNPIAGMNYAWFVSGGGAVLPSSSDTLYVNWGTTPGIYSVSILGNLNNSCETDTATYWVEILATPNVQVQGNTIVCTGEKVSLQASGTNQYTWSNGETSGSADYFPTGNTTAWVVGYDGTCFSDTAFINLSPSPMPNASFTANPPQGEAPLKVSFYNSSTNGIGYFWDFGNGKTSTEENPVNLYDTPGEYTVTLTTQNAAGCSDSIVYQFIVVNEAFSWYIPNAFSPNDDYTNEVFRPYFPDFVEYTLGIFDRWGNIVFKSTSVSDVWDGKMDGKLLPPDVYTYSIEFRLPTDNKQVKKIGSVTLLR